MYRTFLIRVLRDRGQDLELCSLGFWGIGFKGIGFRVSEVSILGARSERPRLSSLGGCTR